MSALSALEEQFVAFREAAVAADPTTTVPTCPEWDVCKLVRHVARVYSSVSMGLRLEPEDPPPKAPRMPIDFDAALSALDEWFDRVRSELTTVPEDRPVWAFFSGGTPKTWTRRMLHETAIHRLDAVSASGSADALVFDSELAADGVDELLTNVLPSAKWSTSDFSGQVLYHAADGGRAWLVTYRPGTAPETSTPSGTDLGPSDVDATVAGTADSVYRRVWGRPNSAFVSGDTALANLATGR